MITPLRGFLFSVRVPSPCVSRILLTFFVLFFALAAPSFAQTTNAWTGGAGLWTNSAKWSLGRVPQSGDRAVVPSSSTIDATSVTALSGIDVTVQNNATVTAPNLVSFTDGALSIDGSGAFNSGDLTNITRARFVITGGAVFDRIAATSYDASNFFVQNVPYPFTIIQVGGAGSRLDLSSVTTMKVGSGAHFYLAEASVNGVLDLSGLTSVDNIGFNDRNVMRFSARDGGVILLPLLSTIAGSGNTLLSLENLGTALPSLTELGSVALTLSSGQQATLPVLQRIKKPAGYNWHRSEIVVPAGAVLNAPQLVSLEGVNVTVQSGGVFNAPNLLSFVDGRLSIDGTGQFNSGALTNISQAQFVITGGAVFDRIAATNYDASNFFVQNVPYPFIVIRVSGTGSRLDLSSVTTMTVGSGAHLYLAEASDNGVVDLSGLPSVENIGFNDRNTMTFVARTGGAILFPLLSTVTGSGNTKLSLENLGTAFPSLTELRSVSLVLANGQQATLPALQRIKKPSGYNWHRSEIVVPAGAVLNAPQLVSLEGVNVTVQNGGVFNAPNLVTFVDGRLSIDGTGQFNSGVLTDISQAQFVITGGAVFDRIAATSYDASNFFIQNVPYPFIVIRVSGAGSRLDLSSVTTMTVGSGAHFYLVEASDNGVVDLSGLTSVDNIGFNDRNVMRFSARNGGVILLPLLSTITGSGDTKLELENLGTALPSLTELKSVALVLSTGQQATLPALQRIVKPTNYNWHRSEIVVPSGAVLNLPELVSLEGVNVFVESGGVFNAPNLTTFVDGRLAIAGTGQFNSGMLTNISQMQFTMTGGAVFDRIAATSYDASNFFVQNVPYPFIVIRVSGAGSRLDLSSVTTMTVGSGGHLYLAEASDNGVVDLSGLPSVENIGFSDRNTMTFAARTGGVILFPLLSSVTGSGNTKISLENLGTAFPSLTELRSVSLVLSNGQQATLPALERILKPAGYNWHRSEIVVPSGAVLNAPELVSLEGVNVFVENGGTFNAPNLVSFIDGRLSISGTGQFNSGALTDIFQAQFFLNGGAVFDRVAATSYDASNFFVQNVPYPFLIARVSGAGSRLDLSSVTTMKVGSGGHLYLVEAIDNGVINLNSLVSLQNIGFGSVTIREGSGGRVLLGSLQNVFGTGTTNIQVGPQADNASPSITEVTLNGSPLADGTLITTNALVRLRATDPSGIASVEASFDSNDPTVFRSSDTGPIFQLTVDPKKSGDGTFDLVITATDSLGNRAQFQRSVVLDVPAPAAPVIATPVSGAKTANENLVIAGTAEAGTFISFFRNGVALPGTVSTNPNGSFSTTVLLPDGPSTFTARATGSGGVSAFSNAVIVTLDTTIPSAPEALLAQPRPGGEIILSWTQPTHEPGIRYDIHRSTSSLPGTATGELISHNTAGQSYHDLPPADGTYYYKVVALNEAGTKSDPSNEASAVSDSTAPLAQSIQFTTNGTLDAGIYGPGDVTVDVTVSEKLLTTPFLSFTPAHGVPTPIQLVRRNDLEYTGVLPIRASSVSGTYFAVFSARDVVGNQGSIVQSGAQLTVDTAGPSVAELTTEPASPIDNTGSPQIAVTIRLSESLKNGTVPQLNYATSTTGIQGSVNLSVVDALSWRGTLSLPVTAGADAPENLVFTFSAIDKLGNNGSSFSGKNFAQITSVPFTSE